MWPIRCVSQPTRNSSTKTSRKTMFETCCSHFGLSVAPSTEDKMISSFLARSTSKKDEKPPPASVYDEAITMLTGSLIIYFFVDLRDMARTGEISATLDDFSPPLTAEEVVGRIQGNEEALAKRAIDSEDLRNRLEALKSLKEHDDTGMFDRMFQSTSNKSHQTILTHIVDAKGEWIPGCYLVQCAYH